MSDLLQLLHIQTLVINGVVCSVIISAGNVFFKRVAATGNNLLVGIVCVLVTILTTTFIHGATFAQWQETILSIFLTMSFCVLFYNLLGQFTVDRLFQWVKSFIQTKTDTPPTP